VPTFELRSIDVPHASPPPQPNPRRKPAVAIQKVALPVLALVATFAVAFLAWRARPAAEPQLSIAVLPFEEYSSTPEGERLAARITDAVTSELARLGSVLVVSRTSARQFEGTRPSIAIIAKTLNADMVMEGTLEANGDRLRVTARLVNAVTDRKVWAEAFESRGTDVTALTRSIAEKSAEAASRRAP
jgi:TolB-like protein